VLFWFTQQKNEWRSTWSWNTRGEINGHGHKGLVEKLRLVCQSWAAQNIAYEVSPHNNNFLHFVLILTFLLSLHNLFCTEVALLQLQYFIYSYDQRRRFTAITNKPETHQLVGNGLTCGVCVCKGILSKKSPTLKTHSFPYPNSQLIV
jgi:hypothetical protein